MKRRMFMWVLIILSSVPIASVALRAQMSLSGIVSERLVGLESGVLPMAG